MRFSEFREPYFFFTFIKLYDIIVSNTIICLVIIQYLILQTIINITVIISLGVKCMKINNKNYYSRMFISIFVFLVMAFSIEAKAENRKYELYNKDSFVDISSFMTYTKLDEINKELIYINIKDLCKVGLQVKDIEGGISISGSHKSTEIYFDTPLNLDPYTFDEPLVVNGENIWINLDIIGKCFSSEYSGELVGDIWRIYIDTGESVAKYEKNSLTVNSCVYNFNYNVCSLCIENRSYYSLKNVKIYTAYYDNDDALIDVDMNAVYKIEGKDSFTTSVPINQYYELASKVKIMIWDGNNLPLLDAIIPKDFKLEITDLPPENIEDREKIFPDVGLDNKYYNAIYVVHKNFDNLGISFMSEDGTFKSNKKVMKNEFAYSLNRIIGNDFLANKFKNIDVDCSIADVEQTNWCKDEIGYLVSMNIMSLSNSCFYPYNSITLDEALSAYLKALGENDFRNSQTPELSKNHNLLDNIYYVNDEITKDIYAQLLYNFSKEYIKTK